MAITRISSLSLFFDDPEPDSFRDMKNALNFGSDKFSDYVNALPVNISVSAIAQFPNTIEVELNVVGTPNDGTTGADSVFSNIYRNGEFKETLFFGNGLTSGSYTQTSSTTFSFSDTVRVESQGTNNFGTDTDVFEDTYGNLPAFR